MEDLAIDLKTSLDVAHIRRTAQIVIGVLRETVRSVSPGVSTCDIAEIVEMLLQENEAGASLKGYRKFPSVVCTSINHVAVHGIPSESPLADGDILTIDLTAEKAGWHADAAWTFVVGAAEPGVRRLLRAAWSATQAGIAAAKAGARFGDVGHAIESTASRFGCSVLDRFVGHGIGKEIHEDPMVLHTGEPETGAPIVPGMVFTIEPILSLGDPDVYGLDDGWSMVTRDHALCAQYEHTVSIRGDRTDVLTWNSEFGSLDADYPPF